MFFQKWLLEWKAKLEVSRLYAPRRTPTHAPALITRRWKRHSFDFPVILRTRRPLNFGILTRGRELNEGGMAAVAAVDSEIGKYVELEFVPPRTSVLLRLQAVVRNRTPHHFGLEFVAHTPDHEREIALLRTCLRKLPAPA